MQNQLNWQTVRYYVFMTATAYMYAMQEPKLITGSASQINMHYIFLANQMMQIYSILFDRDRQCTYIQSISTAFYHSHCTGLWRFTSLLQPNRMIKYTIRLTVWLTRFANFFFSHRIFYSVPARSCHPKWMRATDK